MTSQDPGVPLAHNMSAPPKTTISWHGLGATSASPNGKANAAAGNHAGMFGMPVRFALTDAIACKSPAQILRHLGRRAGTDAAEELNALIDRRAASLPLPEGCDLPLMTESAAIRRFATSHRLPSTVRDIS